MKNYTKLRLIGLTFISILLLNSKSTSAQCQVSKVFINAVLADPNSATNNFDTDENGVAQTADDEFVQICNDSTGDVIVTGWTIADAVGVRYTFGADTIKAGQCITIITDYTGSLPMPSYFRDLDLNTAIWNNGGDDIVLSDGTNSCTETYSSPTAGCVTQLVGTDVDDCTLTPADLGPYPIPIELISFKGKNNNGVAELHWITASEINNEGFYIEKSQSGVEFKTIGFVQGAGTSNKITEYFYNDASLTNTTYYRFKQVDFNGKNSYSDIVKIEDALSYSVKNTAKIYEINLKQQEVRYTLSNLSGQVLKEGIAINNIKIDKALYNDALLILTIDSEIESIRLKIFTK